MRPTIRLKTALPAAIMNNRFSSGNPDILRHWTNARLMPYGSIIPGYGRQYPYSVPHIAVENNRAYSVVALDEIDGGLPDNVPAKAQYSGKGAIKYDLDNATCFN